MLRFSLKPGDYFTVGSDTVVQFDRLTGERVHIMISAPREVPILRGDVLERSGGQRPACVQDRSPQYIRQLPWDHSKKKALAQLRQVLAQMDDCPETRLLQEKLDCIFPQTQGNRNPADAAF